MQSLFNVNFPRAVSEFEYAMHRLQIKKVIYRIIFRGKGLEFDSYRDFGPDEDAQMIDWKATMRAGGRLLAKQYIEERDLKIWFVIDVSDNMIFGSTEQLKCEYAAEIVAALSHLILISGDNVGLIMFSNDIVKVIPPAKGLKRYEAIIRALTDSSYYGGKCNFDKLIKFLLDYLPKTTNAFFIISDFLNFRKEHFKYLKLIATKFEAIAIVVRDTLDEKLPEINAKVVIEDLQTGKQIFFDSKVAKKSYEKYALKQQKELEQTLKSANTDIFNISTDKNFVFPLVGFLNERLRQKKYIIPKL